MRGGGRGGVGWNRVWKRSTKLDALPAQFDGIIARVTKPLADVAQRAKVPLVNVWFNAPVRDLPAVLPDMVAAGRAGAQHLVGRGFRNLGMFGFRNNRSTTDKIEGVSQVAKEAGGRCTHASKWGACPMNSMRGSGCRPNWMNGSHPGHRRSGLWLSRICFAAIWPMLVCATACAFPMTSHWWAATTNCSRAKASTPNCPAWEYGYDRIGRHAAELLDRLMDGEPPSTEPMLISPLEVVARRSTDVIAVDDPMVAQALGLIWDRSHERIGVDDVVSALPISRRSLERRFRRVLDRSIHQEITRARVGLAKRLLIETEDPIKQVAPGSGLQGRGAFVPDLRAMGKMYAESVS